MHTTCNYIIAVLAMDSSRGWTVAGEKQNEEAMALQNRWDGFPNLNMWLLRDGLSHAMNLEGEVCYG